MGMCVSEGGVEGERERESSLTTLTIEVKGLSLTFIVGIKLCAQILALIPYISQAFKIVWADGPAASK